MGTTIARRVGAGATIVLADVDPALLDRAGEALTSEGHAVEPVVVDVSDRPSVRSLASTASHHGRVRAVVHTAGVSPVHAAVEAILRVDLLGTALVLDTFTDVVAPGGAGVVIASMAGSMMRLDADLEHRLATTPIDDLLDLPDLAADALTDPGMAYVVAKRGNQLRVKAASVTWGARGARVNSISPGVIATPMGNAELAGPSGEAMRSMIAGSGTGRIGTPDDIANVVAFLLGSDASFVTGVDLLVDGGVTASLLAG
jgi:NAD(P)-dependent dehydrogenase (short-subunit alcohol dehydrogenase family)